MQQRTPVCLTYPHGTVQFVCVASEKVVWEGEMSRQMLQLEPALVRFAGAAGLNFVEFAFASTANGLCVIAVEPYPQFEHFGDAARQQITEGIVQILTAKLGNTY